MRRPYYLQMGDLCVTDVRRREAEKGVEEGARRFLLYVMNNYIL
jgi:hypothetical protein